MVWWRVEVGETAMDTRRTLSKLEEARFFLWHLREENAKAERGPGSSWGPRAFGYYLSAFLNASYSVLQYLELEAKTELKRGATNKKQAKQRFNEWLADWIAALPADERQVWDHMEEQRGAETHRERAKTVTETKVVPYGPQFGYRGHPAYYGTFVFGGSPLFEDSFAEERQKLGLPLWATAWWEAQVHHFEIEGERRDVVQTCERYVKLLEKLVSDLDRSGLLPSSPSPS